MDFDEVRVLSRRILIQAADLKEMEAFLCESYAPVTLEPLAHFDHYGVDGHVIDLDQVFFEWSQTIGSYRIVPSIPFQSVIFNFVDSGMAGYQFADKKIEVRAGQAIGYRYAQHVDVHDQSRHTSLVISSDFLQKRLSTLLDRPVTRMVEFDQQPVDQSAIPALSTFLKTLKESPLLSLAKRFDSKSGSLSNMIADSVLTGYPHSHREQLSEPVKQLAPRHVKRAISYIHDNPRSRISPDFLAALSNVSVRALQYSFLHTTGQTISEYQLSLRLHHAHKDVLEQRDMPLKVIADRWGFSTPGSFSHSFRKAFGISPSQLRLEQSGPEPDGGETS